MKKQLEIDGKTAREIYKTSPQPMKVILEETFGKEFFSSKIIDRIKTIEDACHELGINYREFINKNQYLDFDIQKYEEIKLVAKALNEGWQPNWQNSNEYKYYPYFNMKSGSGLAYGGYGCDCTGSVVGSRLVYKTKELAIYAGTQFEDIYRGYLTIK